MLLNIFSLTLAIIIFLIFGATWAFIDTYFIKKELNFFSFIPLAIILVGVIVTGVFFVSKVYVIEPDTHHNTLYILGNYEIKTHDGQNIKINCSNHSRITIVNSTLFNIDYYGVGFGDVDSSKYKIPAKIPAHSFIETAVEPDVFPDQKIPRWAEISDRSSHYTIMNVLQFEEDNILPY